MSLFSRKTEKEQDQTVSISSTGDNPLAGVTIANGCFEFGDIANDNEEFLDDANRERVQQAIERLYSDARFHSNVVGLLSWVGKKKELHSLQINPDDEGFKSACDVVYRRLMDGPVGPLLDRLGDAALEDILVCMAGFGPVAFAAITEMRERSQMAAANDDEEKEDE